MSEQMPELTDKQMVSLAFKSSTSLEYGQMVAKAQRELLEGWRKVPSVEELSVMVGDCTHYDGGFYVDTDELHRWLMEGK